MVVVVVVVVADCSEDAFSRVLPRSRTKGRRHAKADIPVPSLGVSIRSMPEVYLRPPLPFLRADFALSPSATDRCLLLLFTPHTMRTHDDHEVAA